MSALRFEDIQRPGAANGENPIPIIVPCYRVIGAKADLTGFGGGVDRKPWLYRSMRER
jgi:methylated-DNA-[protein]-cysteine S-methyltransferase